MEPKLKIDGRRRKREDEARNRARKQEKEREDEDARHNERVKRVRKQADGQGEIRKLEDEKIKLDLERLPESVEDETRNLSVLSGRAPSKSTEKLEGIPKTVSRVLRSGSREAEAEKQKEAVKQKEGSSEAEGSRAAEKQKQKQKQKEEPKGRTRKMEEEMWEKLATETPLKAEHIQELWGFWRENKPDYPEFVIYTITAVMAVLGKFSVIPTTRLVVTLWEKFQEVDEALKVPSTFSKLSFSDREHHLLSASSYSLPLLFQDKGAEAFGSGMCDRHHPAPPKHAIVEELFPKGRYNGSRCAETPHVRESLAGMMCCAREKLGICVPRSIVVGQEEYRMWRWLGEGATSYVYAVDVGSVQCAAKVAKPGHSISMDVSNLEKLKDIKGIPRIVMSDPPSVLLITPVAEQFTLAQLFKNEMNNRVGELVETLECAHNRGIVNRDIRIANILIAEDQFVIVDWGFATASNEPKEYAGTSHFASTRVLKFLEEGQDTLVYEPSDDLVSLVRSLYAFTRVDVLRVRRGLIDLSNDDFAEIREFWETELSNSYWQKAESYAKQCDYAMLKDWIQNEFQRI